MPLRNVDDGLTREEIDGRISQAIFNSSHEVSVTLAKRNAALDTKLDKHKDEIQGIIKPAIAKIDGMEQNVCLLVGNGTVKGLVQQGIDLQLEAKKQRVHWHAEDLEFREVIQGQVAIVDMRVSNVEITTKHNSEILSSIHWIIAMSKSVRRAGDGVVRVTVKGQHFWSIAACIIGLWIAALQQIRNYMPQTYAWTENHHRIVWTIGILVLLLANSSRLRQKQELIDEGLKETESAEKGKTEE